MMPHAPNTPLPYRESGGPPGETPGAARAAALACRRPGTGSTDGALALAALVICLLLGSAALADEPAERWDRYRVIAERNIFSPDRGAPTSAAGGRADGADDERQVAGSRSSDREDADPPEPAARFTLVGVSTVGERPFAFFEDADTGQIITTRIGQVLADRTVTAITLDTVEHTPIADREAEPATAEIGQTLLGDAPRAARSRPARPAGRQRPAAPSDVHDGQVQSILEALRREREQELNR